MNVIEWLLSGMTTSMVAVLVAATALHDSPTSAELARQATVRIEYTDETGGMGWGSGVVISPTTILTAAHVVDEPYPHFVRFVGHADPVEAKLLWISADQDLAVITAEVPEDLVPAEVNCDPAGFGEEVMAIGYPQGAESVITRGGFGSDILFEGGVPLDLLINSGNSGGPVFDETGRVRGIVVSIYKLQRTVGLGVPLAVPAPAICQHLGI